MLRLITPIALLAGALMALPAAPAAAHATDDAGSNPLGLAWLETPELRLVYPAPGLAHLTPHTVRTFTASARWQRARFGWTPSDKPTVMLKDFGDVGQGSASVMPWNRVLIEVAPNPNVFDTNPGSERMASLMNHELVHVAQGDVANAQDRFWRGLLHGKVLARSEQPESLLYSWLTTPRFTVPRWLLEGAAVFMETWMGGGLGRAQGGYDEMVFRGMVRDGTAFHDPLGLASRGTRSDFQAGANAYLYGTRFITWLAHEHGPEQVVAWLRRDEGSLRHYAAAFAQVFGQPLDAAWQQWVAFEHSFQRENLAGVRQVPISPLQPLTAQALGSSSRLFLDAERQLLYGAFRPAGVVEHIGAINLRDGSVTRLADIEGGALYSVSALAHDPVGRQLFYTARNHQRRDLVRLDLSSGETTVLLKEARIGDLAFNRADRSLLGVRQALGQASLVRLLPPYDRWETLHTFPYGEVPAELDVSPDGRLLAASVNDAQGEEQLRVWSLPDLLADPGRLVTVARTSFGQAAPEGFVFTPDGRALVGSSYYTGVSNIFRYHLDSGRTEAVSNAEVGLFRPLPRPDGQLVVLAYTGTGLQPALLDPQPLDQLSAIRFLGSVLAAKHPQLQRWQVDSPTTVDDAAVVTPRGIYRPLEHVALQSAYPVLQGYQDTLGLGYRLNYGDPLGYADASLTLAVTPGQGLPSSERLHLDAKGSYLGWRSRLSWNRADFYDLFGPTKRSRKGLALQLGHDLPLIHELPRRMDLRLDLSRYTGIDTLPGAQNTASSGSTLTTAELGLKYSHLRRSLGAVDDEKGIAAQGALMLQHAQGRLTPQLQGSVDLGWSLPWRHAALWSRTAAGASRGSADNPLANFYFGGFGNNRVDNGPVQRYREPGALPGFEIDAVSGRSFVRQQLDLLLPRVLFASAGVPDLHATWLRPQLFAAALWTEPGRASARRYGTVGAQVDLRLGLLHWYELVLSAGYATGFTGGQRTGSEWMLSLKVM
ncbi:MAG: hypothetical protein IV093_09195 [Rubrivivax sp.]|nr:hypothetical protein [Rubrivivax sp.]